MNKNKKTMEIKKEEENVLCCSFLATREERSFVNRISTKRERGKKNLRERRERSLREVDGEFRSGEICLFPVSLVMPPVGQFDGDGYVFEK